MFTLLILFLVSSLGITLMIGRKWRLASQGHITFRDSLHPFVPDIQKVKFLAVEGTKKSVHFTVVNILRLHVKSSNAIKNKYTAIKARINDKMNEDDGTGEKVGVSKYLKMISDYKQKIREIKHKIHEEENNQ